LGFTIRSRTKISPPPQKGMRKEEIEKSAEEIIETFVKVTEDLPKVEETYYATKLHNILRPDGEPTDEEERARFREGFLKIAPSTDEQGGLRVEVAKWK